MHLNFSQFAQLLYPYCGQYDTKSKFVITLTNKLLKRPGICNKDGNYANPLMNKSSNYLGKFFRGERSTLPRKDTNVLLGKLDKYRFESFIREFSDDAQRNIAASFNKCGISSVNEKNVPERCADIFEDILKNGKYEE